jgi:hypothetical protein
MKELVECFIAWLQAEPATNNAWKILNALARETLKRVDSPDPEQREFDAAQLAEVCRPEEVLDYENAKKWFVDAKVLQFVNARKNNLEAFFVAKGHERCLCLDKRASGGRHKAVNLPLFDVPLSHSIMRPSIAVPRASVLQIAWG